MKITGIIAEYNPFHNGHKYHLNEARRLTGADYIVAVISGDFMQRGTPAITDKHTRAKMALQNGADLVLELPLFYSAGSAEFFALGAVTLLDKLGAVDSLCFGSECGDIHALSRIASILLDEPEGFRLTLQNEIKKGSSFPKARSTALRDYLSATSPLSADFSHILSSPNNILGIEYMKALLARQSGITPYTVARKGNDYHDDLLTADYRSLHETALSSATAIRNCITHPESSFDTSLAAVKEHVPASVYKILEDNYQKNLPIDSSDFSLLLRYRLFMEAENDYTRYLDITSDLSDKIEKNKNNFVDYEQFCTLLKSKDMTYSRISRSLLHILLDMTNADLFTFTQDDYIYYARILGLRKASTNMLGQLKASTSIPLISKLADASSYLEGHGLAMLKHDIRAAHIYDSVAASKFGTPFVNEYSKQIIIV